VVLTAVAVAVNPALEAPAATVTEAGTVSALLLLARLTTVALVTADVKLTVHPSVPAPASVALPHVTPLNVAAACPVPLNAIVPLLTALLLEALLLIVTIPLTAPVDVGSKPTVSIAVCPGFKVIGALTPDTENPCPAAVAPLRINCAVPDEVTITVLLIGVFSKSVPNATLVALKLSPGATAFSTSGYVVEAPPAVAVSVAVCVVLTADAVALNPALDAPTGTVTDAGTVTAPLLLARFTSIALAAAPVSVTVHASVPAPVSDALPHDTDPKPPAGVAVVVPPVPVNAIVAVTPPS